jgi:hypothetical protein
MANRRRSPAGPGSATAKPAGRWPRSDIKHTSVYLPEAAYEALRQVAFDERRKIHDLLIEGAWRQCEDDRTSCPHPWRALGQRGCAGGSSTAQTQRMRR